MDNLCLLPYAKDRMACFGFCRYLIVCMATRFEIPSAKDLADIVKGLHSQLRTLINGNGVRSMYTYSQFGMYFQMASVSMRCGGSI